jgi:hypothetical protein
MTGSGVLAVGEFSTDLEWPSPGVGAGTLVFQSDDGLTTVPPGDPGPFDEACRLGGCEPHLAPLRLSPRCPPGLVGSTLADS